jgi:hypothetical protein
MSDSVQSWLEKAAASPGVLACGVRLGDRTMNVKSCREEVTEQKVTQAMRELSEAIHALQQNRVHAERIRWQFENGHIRCLSRPGGVMAALVVTKEAADLPEIEGLLTDFAAMFA